MSLQDLLLKQWKAQQWAPFYLLQVNDPWMNESGKQLFATEWLLDCLNRYAQTSHSLETLKNSLDILWLAPNDKKKQYSLADLQTLWGFVDLGVSQWPHKFIILEQADKITPVLANKLLKVLEDCPAHTSFIWLNPLGKKMLATIESRAMRLRPSPPQNSPINANQQEQSFERWLQQQDFAERASLQKALSAWNQEQRSFNQLFEHFKQHPYDLEWFLKQFLEWTRQQPQNYQQKEEILQLWAQSEKMQRFHQPWLERCLHTLLTTHQYFETTSA